MKNGATEGAPFRVTGSDYFLACALFARAALASFTM